MAGFLAAHLDGADVTGALRAGAQQAARALSTVELNPILESTAGRAVRSGAERIHCRFPRSRKR